MTVTAGVKHLVVNGTQWPTAETATYSVQTRSTESILGAVRHGRSVKGKAAFVEVDVFLGEGVSAADMTSARNADVSLVCEDRTITLSADADFIGDGDVDASKNSLKARFEAKSGREVF